MSALRLISHFAKPFRILGIVATLTAGGLADGLPDEYLVNQRWRELFSIHSPLINPAYLTEENYAVFRGAFAPTLQSAFRLWEMGVSVPIGLYQSAGVTWVGLNSGEYQGTRWGAGGVENTGMIGSQSNAFLLSYAVNPIGRLSVGVNLQMIQESTPDGTQRVSLPPGVDFALTYRLLNHPFFGLHRTGISLQNLLAPKLAGADAQPGDTYTRTMRFSLFSRFWESRIESGFDFDLKDWMAQAGDFSTGSPLTEFEIYYRLGIWVLRTFKLYGQYGIDENNGGRIGFAAGVNMPSVNLGRELEVVYQYNNMLEQDNISTHTIYLRAELGKHREEVYARKMARKLDSSPNDLYNQARSLYHARRYWDAFLIFGDILSQHPDFFKNDWVAYYLSSCQENMDMRGNAIQRYRSAISEYPESEIVPHAELGLMRIAYRERDGASVYTQYTRLTRGGVPDSIQAHAYYLMGQTLVREGEHERAVGMFSLIRENHPDFSYAMHSVAVCLLTMGQYDQAVDAIENVIANAPGKLEIVNRTYLLAGLLYYEKGKLSKAAAILRLVPATSIYYEEALLGLGWSALKSRQWGDCIQAGKTLVKTSRRPIMQSEGLLLEGYALLVQKQFAAARDVLAEANRRITSVTRPAGDELEARRRTYGSDRQVYDRIAAAAFDMTLSRRTPALAKVADSLGLRQREVKGRLDAFMEYSDEFERASFFTRSLDQVRSDIEYALATAERSSGAVRTDRELEKESARQQEIEREIERVKRELEQIKE